MNDLLKKNKIAIYICIPLFFIWLFCFKMISPGHVGILVNLFGENKGPEAKELRVGMHWIAPWKKVYIFPIYEQNYTWERLDHFSFQSSEGLSVHAEVGISYHLKLDEVHKLFCKFRRGIDEITDIFIKNYIRDAINSVSCQMTVEQLYGKDKEKFMRLVQESVKKDLEALGIEVDRIYLIGRLHFPDSVMTALNAKIEATQRAQQRENELREAEAQAKKEIAKAQGEADSKLIRALAEANANKEISKSMSMDLIFYKAIEKWDGRLPQVTSNSTPILDLRNQ